MDNISQMWASDAVRICAMSKPSEFIKQRMREEGLNPRGLALAAKMNYSTLHRILNEHGEVRRSTLKPLAKYFKVSVDEFFVTRAEDESNPLDAMDYEQIKEWTLENFSADERADLANALVQSIVSRATSSK